MSLRHVSPGRRNHLVGKNLYPFGTGRGQKYQPRQAIASPFDKNKCPGFDTVRFWSRSFLTAELATHLYHFMPEMLRHDLSTLLTAGTEQGTGSYPEIEFNGLYWEEANVIGIANSIAYDVQHQQQRTVDDERLLTLGISNDNIQQLYAHFEIEKEKNGGAGDLIVRVSRII